jgi:adenylate cyclase
MARHGKGFAISSQTSSLLERRPDGRLTFGVRGRLLLAFLTICLFSLVGAASGFISLSQVGRSLSRITGEEVPQALSWLELSRQAERVVRAAPALLAVMTEDERVQVSAEIAAQADQLNQLLQQIGSYAAVDEARTRARVQPLVEQFNQNLAGLDDLVKNRIFIATGKESLIKQLAQANMVAQRLISSSARVLDAQMAEWNRTGAMAEANPLSADQSAVARSIIGLIPQQYAGALIDSVNNALLKMAAAESPTEIDVMLFPLQKTLANLSDISQSVPDNIKKRLATQIGLFEMLTTGPSSLAQVRKDELATIAQIRDLLAVNGRLSGDLTKEVSRLVAEANADIATSRSHASAIQVVNRNVLLIVIILSLVTSILIIWLYVGRNLIRRLTALSDSMLAIAGGDLRAPLPAPGGGDEIGRMAEALIVFRDTAIEVEKSNLREIESARRRLVDAIESSSEGFAFYDTQDCLVICNSRYRELLYPGTDLPIEPGMEFAAIVRRAAENGLITDAEGRIEEWVAERVNMHRNPGKPRLQQRRDGRWVLISERKTGDGGTVAVYSDITDLKHREEELTAKSNALEQLSNQLAKYLSPQVYESIFSGRQQVKLVSQRKRLTVFFSDLAGFTQTTEMLESEDLTRLLNQYLTEMSEIALTHGATIDKYVGDAIVIFFGDPETRGVKEDAIACVKMAIAMRERMMELENVWRASGVENPLRCRMGINTGVCTVGNFGSEARMDYTIIGAGVNLAARLEAACTPREILISYETHAHVKDLIYCEERSHIEVKGIAHPVSTYCVIDLYENLGEGKQAIRAKLPHLQLDVDVAMMSPEEQREAATVLLDAAKRLSSGTTKV